MPKMEITLNGTLTEDGELMEIVPIYAIRLDVTTQGESR